MPSQRNHDEENQHEDEEQEAQIEAMRDWFFKKYERPEESLPYESAEGGFIYIWGGPYTADEVLLEEFGDKVPRKLIQN